MQYGLRALALAGAALLLAFAAAAASADDDFADSRRLARWVQVSGDHKGLPYALVDKHNARIHVFHADGRLAGSSAALLGETRGDHTVPGVGARAQTGQVRADERTTPAGRFVSEPGRNLKGEHVVWADYASAFAIHRLRPGSSYKMRAVSLASGTPEDNRRSLGCVVVPVTFYRQVVEPVLGRGRAVIYVMPETRSVQEVFGAL